MSINAKQEAFCQEYVICMNATEAAKKAGYSPRTANEQGARLLANVSVKQRISELQAELAERNKLRADDIINELRELAFWSIDDFIGEGNRIKDLSTLNKRTLKPVVGIKVKEVKLPGDITVITTELKLSDKRPALEDLGRHLGIFEKDNRQKVTKFKVTRK